MQRGNGDTVAIADRHRTQARPLLARPDREALGGQFDIGPLVHAEIDHRAAHAFGAKLVRQPRGHGVRRMDQRLDHVEIGPHRVAVLDREAADLDRARIPPAAEIAHHAGIDRGRDRQRLEGRTEFVDLVGHAVEHQFLAARIDLIGIEFGQGSQRQHFAGVDIEHDARTALRLHQFHPAAQLVLERALDAGIDRQGDRGAARRRIGQMRVEHLLHPHAARSIRRDIAEHMRRHRTLRIVTVVLHRHLECEFADVLHPVGILGHHPPADIALLARCQLRGDRGLIEIRENILQLARDHRRITDQRRTVFTQRSGIEPQRIGGEGARQRHAVAIGYLAARRQQRFFERSAARAIVRRPEIADAHQRKQRHEDEAERDPQQAPVCQRERFLPDGNQLHAARGHGHAHRTISASARGDCRAEAGKGVH